MNPHRTHEGRTLEERVAALEARAEEKCSPWWSRVAAHFALAQVGIAACTWGACFLMVAFVCRWDVKPWLVLVALGLPITIRESYRRWAEATVVATVIALLVLLIVVAPLVAHAWDQGWRPAFGGRTPRDVADWWFPSLVVGAPAEEGKSA